MKYFSKQLPEKKKSPSSTQKVLFVRLVCFCQNIGGTTEKVKHNGEGCHLWPFPPSKDQWTGHGTRGMTPGPGSQFIGVGEVLSPVGISHLPPALASESCNENRAQGGKGHSQRGQNHKKKNNNNKKTKNKTADTGVYMSSPWALQHVCLSLHNSPWSRPNGLVLHPLSPTKPPNGSPSLNLQTKMFHYTWEDNWHSSPVLSPLHEASFLEHIINGQETPRRTLLPRFTWKREFISLNTRRKKSVPSSC